MARFRRVDMNLAGPRALGILVPPGRMTVVIVRPRPLGWDLLPAEWSGEQGKSPVFRQFGRDEAAGVARRLARFLEGAVASDTNPLETFGDPGAGRLQIWLRTGEYFWILCQRAPGQEYRPLVFSNKQAAEQAAEVLLPFIWPRRESDQEYYFNTQHFRMDS